MKPSILSVALLACLPVAASAVMVNPNGRGEVLIYPYYTVEAGKSTTFDLTNHSDHAKAVQIRFREAANGRPVLSFNLYLGAHDMWSATLFSLVADGPANLLTRDDSCTVPGIRSDVSIPLPTLPSGDRYVPFRNFGYIGPNNNFGAGTGDDGGGTSVLRTRSGFIEVIELATLVDGSQSAQDANRVSSTSCNNLVRAWTPGSAGYWLADPGTDTAPPSGGLSGNGSLVDVTAGTVSTFNATALSDFSSIAQHVAPGGTGVTLNSAVSDATAGTVQSTLLTEAGAQVTQWPRSRAFEAVSAALAQASLGNNYLVDSAVSASTEWVLTFPTRHLHTDPALVSAAVAPFSQRFVASSFVPAGTCESAPIAIFNRDGRATVNPDNSPISPTPILLCNTVQVLDFDLVSTPFTDLLGARTPRRLDVTGYAGGHAELDFSAFQSAPATGGERAIGLPVIGFAVSQYASGAVFQSTTPHTGSSACDDCAE